MVAARRPELVKAVIFGDSSIKTDRTQAVMRDYHSYWNGWKKLAESQGPFDEFVRRVSDMPVNVPGQNKKTYGEGLDIIALMNKANYLRFLDPEVLTDWWLVARTRSHSRELLMGMIMNGLSTFSVLFYLYKVILRKAEYSLMRRLSMLLRKSRILIMSTSKSMIIISDCTTGIRVNYCRPLAFS